MSIRIEVEEGEEFRVAFARFKKKARMRHSRNWVKRRYGYFEKPSELRRKRKKLDYLNRRLPSRALPLIQVNLHFADQFARGGPKGFGR